MLVVMKSTYRLAALALIVCLATAFNVSAGTNKQLQEQVKEALGMLKAKDSTFEAQLKKAHGYAIFPSVGKGGFIVGGAGGEGEVYKGGELIGTAKLSQATIGAQIGGQTFIEVILFADRIALSKFRKGQFEMSAGISAVAAAEGVAQKVDYRSGMAVIILPKAGLMAEASIGGQKFRFIPLQDEAEEED